MSMVTINQKQMPILEHQGHRVVTLTMVDRVHERPDGTARKRLNDNRSRFTEGKHLFKVCASEFRTRFPGVISERATEDVTLLTERGYLLLVKSFTDDLAWQVQDQLVEGYFQNKESATHFPAVPGSFADALRLAAALEDQKTLLLAENARQAHKIESLESLFVPGETPAAFAKRLNGVNSNTITSKLLDLGWIYNHERNPKRSVKYRVAHKARSKGYLTERPRKISAEGVESFIKYDLQLLLAGAQKLYDMYLDGKLVMRRDWDGHYSMVKLVEDGKLARFELLASSHPVGMVTAGGRPGEQSLIPI
ncbi:ORF6N domain-containing protein [Pseudomonas aeruginosa]|uniref:ORF6N domain-containing protein n=1 Tax=Pseudomonas aeruginosa TaxID=287 RepID=UPI0022EBF821|nr:ORF6N domain-containing protein [Pseudomonas aeruginosa]